MIGHGKIGKEVAIIGAALGMNPLIASSSPNSKEGHLSIEEVLKQSDIVTLHASTKANSEPLITSEQISMMKDGAILINTARGSLLNYKDLEEALRSGKLYGAVSKIYSISTGYPVDWDSESLANFLVTVGNKNR